MAHAFERVPCSDPQRADAMDQLVGKEEEDATALGSRVSRSSVPHIPLVVKGYEQLAQLRGSVDGGSARLLPTGCASIDELLKGGLREGQMVELVGEPTSGKTQAAALTAGRGEGVVYVDTGASFAAQRLVQLLGGLRARGEQPLPDAQALANVEVHAVHNIHALLSLLYGLAHRWEERAAGHGPQPGAALPHTSLLIVDSLSAVVAPVLGAAGPMGHGHALMVTLGRVLKRLAAAHVLAVLVTNHTVSGGSSRPPAPALGDMWRTQAHVRVMLDCGEGAARLATLMTCAIAPRAQAAFQLATAGLLPLPGAAGAM